MMSEMIAGPLSTMQSLLTQFGATLVLGRYASSKEPTGNRCKTNQQTAGCLIHEGIEPSFS